MPRQTSVQLTEATERQVEALKTQGFGTTTDIIRLAIDRLYQVECVAQQSAAPRRILTPDERENIIAWATSRVTMVDRQLVNRDGVIDMIAQEFGVPRHCAANAVGHIEARLRKPGRADSRA